MKQLRYISVKEFPASVLKSAVRSQEAGKNIPFWHWRRYSQPDQLVKLNAIAIRQLTLLTQDATVRLISGDT